MHTSSMGSKFRLTPVTAVMLLLGWGVTPAIWGQDVVHVVNDGVGVFTNTPEATLHVFENSAATHNRVLYRITGADFSPQFEYQDGSTGDIWREGMNPNGHFVINQMDDPTVAEMRVTPDGQVFVNGTQVHPEYVFDGDYELMDLDALDAYVRKNRHLPGVVSSEKAQGKIDLSSFPLQLLEKIEELTLYTIQQQELIQRLQESNEELEARLADLETRDQG